ncbi:hypothetical protein CesoFtcFv8_000080 [Champsocephalus esox]|uniref:Uncharacterized protein n=1 Tax=Champsocephalus esox TaxID=159716 RepID=A0AAN8HWI2_9TELE|nr:hypothetical protein CesoFtcFv8_000080 [Champsocephalus esox]
MKAWLSRGLLQVCESLTKVIPAASDPPCSPPPSPTFFLLFSPSWRRALVARFITSDLAWMLSWRQIGWMERYRGKGTG